MIGIQNLKFVSKFEMITTSNYSPPSRCSIRLLDWFSFFRLSASSSASHSESLTIFSGIVLSAFRNRERKSDVIHKSCVTHRYRCRVYKMKRILVNDKLASLDRLQSDLSSVFILMKSHWKMMHCLEAPPFDFKWSSKSELFWIEIYSAYSWRFFANRRFKFVY